ncbi:phosphatidylinositol-specific phospholipase C/glycerophosphodiester phosphodiesterase family protein [Paenibacillus herberti]|uniref:Glycerophosphodiester phosphodiesterase n=1 Tax=Paenibacillus herberti TaxID=1619309 RepID=A0A229NTF2_9BACL|nr:phosphatidylinositol-specific phospholipase C/glycerophosphodiester phosphodiesterase family protein [Paenibacillus herberti]OXM13128.1 glycerophosphodiester phosphodiesterase [Paenibacillus herberti]
MNKWFKRTTVGFAALLCVSPLLSGAKPAIVHNREAPPAWTSETLIAHAMGSVDQYFYTNSREALQQNYRKGYRVFEVDLQLTTDNYLVSRHDWGSYLYDRFEQTLPREKMDKPLPLKSILNLPILGSYQAMSFEDIADLLQNYPDIWIVTDTKAANAEEARLQFEAIVRAANGKEEVLTRIVPQLYSREMLDWVESVHSFPSYIYTLYQSPDSDGEVLDFVKMNDRVDAITMPEDRALNSRSLISKLNSLRVPVYANTINDPDIIRKLAHGGVHGFYSDSMTYSRLEEERIKLGDR